MFAFRTPEPSAATRAREDAAQDLAQDAMNSKSFHLACEIFERHISQYGPSFRLYLLLGDAYAKGERFQEAIDAYIAAYRWLLFIIFLSRHRFLLSTFSSA